MRLNKRIIGLLALVICMGFTFLAFYLLYLPNWNVSYQIQQEYVEKSKTTIGVTLGNYSSKDEALRENSIKEYKEWTTGDITYILGATGEDVTLHKLILYRFYSNTLVQLTNSMCIELDISEPGYDGYWYDGQFTTDIVSMWTYSNYSLIHGDEIDIYFGIWIGNGIKQISVSKGNLTYEKIDIKSDNGDECYLWTYEIEKSDSVLNNIGKKRIEADEHGDGQKEYYEYRLIDAKKALGVDCSIANAKKVIIYWIITVVFIVSAVVMILIYLKSSVERTIISRKEIIALTLSIVFSCLSIFMVLMYIYNTDLIFGTHAINGIIHRLTGHYIPNIL